jgi:hypothetical protein
MHLGVVTCEAVRLAVTRLWARDHQSRAMHSTLGHYARPTPVRVQASSIFLRLCKFTLHAFPHRVISDASYWNAEELTAHSLLVLPCCSDSYPGSCCGRPTVAACRLDLADANEAGDGSFDRISLMGAWSFPDWRPGAQSHVVTRARSPRRLPRGTSRVAGRHAGQSDHSDDDHNDS